MHIYGYICVLLLVCRRGVHILKPLGNLVDPSIIPDLTDVIADASAPIILRTNAIFCLKTKLQKHFMYTDVRGNHISLKSQTRMKKYKLYK